ncbi:MAG: hypothetical protein J7L55_05070 [Desulfurococcales archaeon]|nr:hypothetical protein [Desulfurococcales archaeon]
MLSLPVKVVKTLYGYLYMDAPVDEALKVLEAVKASGRSSEDLEDSIRILKNFSVFYDMLRRKFKEYLAPKKNERDLIYGNVVVEKLRLYRKDGEGRVVVVFDKRFPEGELKEILDGLGMTYEYGSE